MKKIVLFILFSFSLISCEKENGANLILDNTQYITSPTNCIKQKYVTWNYHTAELIGSGAYFTFKSEINGTLSLEYNTNSYSASFNIKKNGIMIYESSSDEGLVNIEGILKGDILKISYSGEYSLYNEYRCRLSDIKIVESNVLNDDEDDFDF